MEEWFVLEEVMEDICRQCGLHVASCVIRRITSSRNCAYPSHVRISRLNGSDFAQLQSMKKEADLLFSKKRYAEAIRYYEYMLIHPRIQNFFVAPLDQVNVVISIISNQTECYLRCKDYNATASTATDVLVLAQAEIFLYEQDKRSLLMLVQADVDLEITLKFPNEDKMEQNEAEVLSKTLKEYLSEEKQKLPEIDPQADFESKVSAIKSQCSKLRIVSKNVDYIIFLPTRDILVKVRNPKVKAFFRKMRELAVEHSFSVMMMYQIPSSYRPDEKELIQIQLKLEYHIDHLDNKIQFYDISTDLRGGECALMMIVMASMNKQRL